MLTESDLKETQNLAIDRLYDTDETLLIAPKGFGKCVVGFTALQELIKDEIVTRVLVLSTAQVCTQVWDREPEVWEHLRDLDYVCLTGNDEAKRKKLMATNSSIVICNFELMAWLFTEYSKHNFDALMVDEITKLKSVGGVGFKKIRKHLKAFSWRCGMTADPVAQESVEIYGQMLIIDQGKRLGRNKDNFKRKYFMQTDYMGNKWDIQPGGLARLTKALSTAIYTVDSTDYEAGLPELIDIPVPVTMPEVARRYYKELVKHNFVYVDHQAIEAPNEAVLQGKLFQLCCGSIYHMPEDDEYSAHQLAKKVVLDIHSVKMSALDKIVKSIDTPILIAYQFSFQRDELIKKYNAPVFSAKNSKKFNENLKEMWNTGQLPMMLVHPKSAGHGLNLQYGTCFTLVCLGYFWSADEWDQLIGRLRRRGQQSKIVNRYTIFCKDTIEDCVMKPRLDARDESSKVFHEYVEKQKILPIL